ncbi:MAG TPA: Clp protease N-terminal domain-containing protein [Gaiellaceae bacterium]|nr:Clp protease N-terminal domain-containing protein [Gaiellaceae bacterium]HXV96067.1 Clp protease N-terminal domain-containing protein [Gaiellaceae bacterium]
MTPLDPATLREARDSRDRMLEAQHELERARADYGHAIRRLHAEGGSLREIAESLGLSHQRVHQIVEGEEGGPARKGSRRRRFDWPFARFTRRARQVIVLAQEEADALGQTRAGSEHLLLGLARAEDEATAPLLAEAGLTADSIRERVATLEPGPARGRGSFTRAAKRALETSVHEAKALGDNYIGAEHILLGLTADERSGATAIVRDLGADPEALRAGVRAARASDA